MDPTEERILKALLVYLAEMPTAPFDGSGMRYVEGVLAHAPDITGLVPGHVLAVVESARKEGLLSIAPAAAEPSARLLLTSKGLALAKAIKKQDLKRDKTFKRNTPPKGGAFL